MALEGESRFRARDRQRDDARAVANARRSSKARLKKLIRDRDIDAVEVLNGSHPEWQEAVAVLKVEELLRSIPRIGRMTIEEVGQEMGVSMHTRLRNLTVEQRAKLVEIMRLLRGDILD